MKKRGKKIKHTYIRPPMIIGSALVFGPIQAIIDQLDIDGTLTCSPKGRPMFKEPEYGMWCDTAEALNGMIRHLEMYEVRHGLKLPLDSLRQFQRFVDHVMNIPESLMTALKRDLPVLQRVMALGDPEDILDIFRQTQIKNELEKINANT